MPPDLMVRALLVLALASTYQMFGQSPEGAILGTVNDATGARVPGAYVEVASLASGAKRELSSDNRGEFTIEFLSPGGYRTTVSKPGFAPAIATVDLSAGFSQAVVVTLRPAVRRESIEVQAPRS